MPKTVTLRLDDISYDILKKHAHADNRPLSNYIETATLKYIEEIDMGFNTKLFRELSEYVATASARFIPTWKPIVGANLFVYESENRAHAVTVDPSTYELFKPEDVGLERKIIVGKYSGVSALKSKLDSLGYKVKDEEAKEISEITRSKSVALKRSLYDSEIVDVYKSYKGKSGKKKLNKNKSGKKVSAVKAKGGK